MENLVKTHSIDILPQIYYNTHAFLSNRQEKENASKE